MLCGLRRFMIAGHDQADQDFSLKNLGIILSDTVTQPKLEEYLRNGKCPLQVRHTQQGYAGIPGAHVGGGGPLTLLGPMHVCCLMSITLLLNKFTPRAWPNLTWDCPS